MFPALSGKGETEPERQPVALEGGAECFFCEGETATHTCSSCGRFLCERCQIDWSGEGSCLTCVHAHRELKDDDRFKNRRVLYDNVALSMLFWPMVLPVPGIFFSAMFAPVALFLALRFWKSSRGIVPRGRLRSIVVITVSVILLVMATLWMGTVIYA